MTTQIDPAFLHARDSAVISGAACKRLRQASTFDQESRAKVLLKHRLHHRAAAEVADTDTETLLDYISSSLNRVDTSRVTWTVRFAARFLVLASALVIRQKDRANGLRAC